MTKEFKDWLDEFVEQGANPKDVTNWPEEVGGTIELQDKTVSPSTNTQKITPDEGYDGLSKVTVNAVTNTIDSNIKAGNIKKDVAVLGVTGTYEGEPVELQDKTVSPSTNTQEIVADKNYDGLGKVTINDVTSAIDSNIKAGNIKKDVSILGVTGTYEGGGSGGVSYQLICNNREDLVSKSYRVDWSKLPDFIKNNFGINPDLTLGEIGDIEGQYAVNSFDLQFPLAMEDNNYYDGGNPNYFKFENPLFFQLNFGSSGVATLRSEGYLNGFLDFNVTFSYSITLKEAILQLPTTTSGSSSGIYALLILGAITLTEISE